VPRLRFAESVGAPRLDPLLVPRMRDETAVGELAEERLTTEITEDTETPL